MTRLNNRVAIVTGGAHGIGRAYVRRLLDEGACVVIADVDGAGARAAADEEQAADSARRTLAIQVDVADEVSTQRMVDETLRAFGRVDVLVNNAALFGTLAYKPIEEIGVDEWDRVFAVNSRGVFLCCRAAIPVMKRQQYGRIVNISSGALLGAAPRFSHYIASKGAVFALTRTLAKEVGPFGITVNTVSPGLTLSEGARSNHTEDQIAATRQSRALPRDQQPEDLAGAVAFLASDDSAFMTGQMMVINGGSTLW